MCWTQRRLTSSRFNPFTASGRDAQARSGFGVLPGRGLLHGRGVLHRRCVLPGVLVVMLAVGGAGCGKPERVHLTPPAASDSSLVFGYIDMGDAPTELGWVTVNYESGGASEELEFLVSSGVFYRENLGSGSYSVAKFGGSTGSKFISIPKLGLRSFVNFRYDIPPHAVGEYHAKTPGVHFLGAYKYEPLSEGRDAAGAGGVVGRAVFWKTTSFNDPLGQRPFGSFQMASIDSGPAIAEVREWAQGTAWSSMFANVHTGEGGPEGDPGNEGH